MANYDDVFYSILLRLPFKSLLRFESLSQEWNSVISDPRFCKSHLQITSQGKDHNNFIIFSHFQPIAILRINDSGTVLQAQQIHCPYERSPIPNDPRRFWKLRGIPYFVYGIAHCDGLLCVAPSSYQLYEPGDDTKIVVWNPLTMQNKIFPLRKPNRFWYQYHWETIGLGYDSVLNDYKIIHVMGHDDKLPPKVRSLRLKLGSWESAQIDVPYFFRINNPTGTLLNGCLYWICNKFPDGNAVLCFDLHKARMREETSLSTVVGLKDNSQLGLLNGTLYLANDHDAVYTEIWTMKQDDDAMKTKSWVKMMRIPSASQSDLLHYPASPILVTRNGLVLTKDRHDRFRYGEDDIDEFSLFNPTDGSLNIVPLHGVEFDMKVFGVIPYVESLVSP